MKFRMFLFTLPVLAGLLAMGIGAAPRYIEEIAVGGGYGNTGTWLEADGDILSNGDATFDGQMRSKGTLTTEHMLRQQNGSSTAFAQFGADSTGSTLTVDTNKVSRGAFPHYTQGASGSPVSIWTGLSQSGLNYLYFGGGAGSQYAATQLMFMTAANATTPTGTARLTINSAGNSTFTGNLNVQGGEITAGTGGGTRGILTAWDGSGGASPGSIKLASPNGTLRYLFVDDSGRLRIHSALPTSSTDGTVVGLQF